MSAPASFQQQLVELIPRLRRFARGLTRSAADADDVAQAAIERALMHQETWRPGTRLDSWVYRIAQNLWRDELRAHRRRAESLDAAQVGGEDGRESFVRHIEVGEVAASFHQLPEEQRLVLTLVVPDRWSSRGTPVVRRSGMVRGGRGRLGRWRCVIVLHHRARRSTAAFARANGAGRRRSCWESLFPSHSRTSTPPIC